MKITISFGDYGLLEQLRDGSTVTHAEGKLTTMFDAGLIVTDERRVLLTDAGLAYLKATKKPPFPKSRKFENESDTCAVCKVNKTLATCSECRVRLVAHGINPDDERQFFNQCVGKIKYLKLDSAENAVSAMLKKKEADGSGKLFDIYKCGWCSIADTVFHIGGKYIPKDSN